MTASAALFRTARTLPQNAPQSHPAVQIREHGLTTVLDAPEPAAERWVQDGHELRQTVAIATTGFRTDAVLKLLEALLTRESALNRQPVGIWRVRWRDAGDALCVWECTAPHRLREAILDVLSGAPRPGTPATFTAGPVSQIVALACEPPRLSGRPVDHGTLRELRDEAIPRTIVTDISASPVGRFRQRAAVRPHRQNSPIEVVFGIIHRKLLRGGNFTSVADLEFQLR